MANDKNPELPPRIPHDQKGILVSLVILEARISGKDPVTYDEAFLIIERISERCYPLSLHPDVSHQIAHEAELEMKEANAYTIAQDEKSCVVFGMPNEAIKLGGVEKIVSLDKIASTMIKEYRRRR